ncbi:MAG: hypothetical protein ACK5LS_01995 [Propioniciclava sp.]
MSRAVASAPPLGATTIAGATRRDLLQVIAGLGMAVDLEVVGSLTYSAIATGALIIYGLAHRPRFTFGRFIWVPAVLGFLLVYLAAVSVFTLQSPLAFSWSNRLIRLTALTVLAMFLATERLQLRSVVIGMALGITVNVPLFWLGLVPDTYGGVLTGYAGDKNTAGMVYSVMTVLALWAARGRVLRAIILLGGTAAVWMTDSRTAMMGLLAAMLWMLVAARRPIPIRWIAAGLLIWLIRVAEQNLAHIGQFADRIGSDLLRQRIDSATALKLASTPWWGSGLGEGYVLLGTSTWLFHDAYAVLRVEGGWVFLLGSLAVVIGICLRPLTPGREPSRDSTFAQGAAVALLVTAWKLGDVFYTVPWALTVGLGTAIALTGARTYSDAALAVSPDDG